MESLDVDSVMRELERRVATRRANGDYPPGLEEQLEAEFERIMAAVHRPEVESTELQRRIDSVRDRTSSRPSVFGSVLKIRSTDDGLGTAVVSTLDEVRRLFDAQRKADERQLHEVVAALLDRAALVDHLAQVVLDLERRVGQLETSTDQ
jgi:hypothetical protein